MNSSNITNSDIPPTSGDRAYTKVLFKYKKIEKKINKVIQYI